MAKALYISTGLACLVAVTVCGCAAPSFLSEANVKKQSSKNTVATSQNPPASQTSQPAEEKELPPIDVAGVHLVSDCQLLSAAGVQPETMSVECSLKSPNETVEAVINEPVLVTNNGQDTIPQNGISAKPANSGNGVFVLGPQNPIRFHFDLPFALSQSIAGTEVNLQFARFDIAGRPANASLSFPTLVRKEVPPAACQTFKTSSPTWIQFLPEQTTMNLPVVGNVTLTTGEPLQSLIGEISAVQIFLTSINNPLPVTAKRICSVQILKPLEVTWTNANSSLLSQQSVMVMLGQRILFNSINPMETYTYNHPNFRIAELFDLSGIASISKPFPEPVSNLGKWCPYGLTTCTFTPTSSKQTIDLRGLPSEVLEPVAMNLFNKVDDLTKFMPLSAIGGQPQPQNVDVTTLPLAVYFAWPNGLTSPSASPPQISNAKIELKYTYSE